MIFHRKKKFFEYLLKHYYISLTVNKTYCKLFIFSCYCAFFAFVLCAFNDFNLADISSIVVSIFAFRFPMSNDNKCEGFSNLNCFSIILKFKSLFGSKLISLEKFRRVSAFTVEQEKNF
jgi:hypothetical protein